MKYLRIFMKYMMLNIVNLQINTYLVITKSNNSFNFDSKLQTSTLSGDLDSDLLILSRSAEWLALLCDGGGDTEIDFLLTS